MQHASVRFPTVALQIGLQRYLGGLPEGVQAPNDITPGGLVKDLQKQQQ
jgi:hypothetical protein